MNFNYTTTSTTTSRTTTISKSTSPNDGGYFVAGGKSNILLETSSTISQSKESEYAKVISHLDLVVVDSDDDSSTYQSEEYTGFVTLLSNPTDANKADTKEKLNLLLRHNDADFRCLGRKIVTLFLKYTYVRNGTNNEEDKQGILDEINQLLQNFKVQFSDLSLDELKNFINPVHYSYTPGIIAWYSSPYITGTFKGLLQEDPVVFKICCREKELQKFFAVHLSIVESELNNFSYTDLTDQNLEGLDFTDCNFIGANLTNARLKNAKLTNSDFTEATLTGASFENALLDFCTFDKTRMVGANLVNSSIELANIKYSNMFKVNLTGAEMSMTNFNDTNLIGATIAHTDLTTTSLKGSVLMMTTFDEVDVRKDNLHESYLDPRAIDDIMTEEKRGIITKRFEKYCKDKLCCNPQSEDNSEQPLNMALRDFSSGFGSPLDYLFNSVSSDENKIEINSENMDNIERKFLSSTFETADQLTTVMTLNLKNDDERNSYNSREQIYSPQIIEYARKIGKFKERYRDGVFTKTFDYIVQIRKALGHYKPIFEKYGNEFRYTESFLKSFDKFYQEQLLNKL